MSWQSMMRASEAAERRHQRQEQARLRSLQRQAKEMAKSSALEQARHDVAIHEAQVSMLLSVHKDQTTAADWRSIAASLPPPQPSRTRHRELRARQDEILAAAGLPAFTSAGYPGAAADARGADEQDHRQMLERYAADHEAGVAERALASRVLAGDTQAFQEVVSELDLFGDAPDVCAGVAVAVHDRHLAEVQLLVRGREVLPTESKALTAAGKVSIKPIPKGRFHEMFQDYVASCVIRVARELFGLLPFDTVLVTASVLLSDSASPAQADAQPVLSVIFPRDLFSRLPFDSLDPSDTVESFTHNGEVKVSRKTGEFMPIVPLTRADLPRSTDMTSLFDTVATARTRREHLEEMIGGLTRTTVAESRSVEEEE